jgi:glycolate oxidase
MIRRMEEIGERYRTLIATVAHARDGNLHPLMLTPPGDEAARRGAQAAFEDIIDAALELGGTGTCEHGVGLLKLAGCAASSARRWSRSSGP